MLKIFLLSSAQASLLYTNQSNNASFTRNKGGQSDDYTAVRNQEVLGVRLGSTAGQTLALWPS